MAKTKKAPRIPLSQIEIPDEIPVKLKRDDDAGFQLKQFIADGFINGYPVNCCYGIFGGAVIVRISDVTYTIPMMDIVEQLCKQLPV